MNEKGPRNIERKPVVKVILNVPVAVFDAWERLAREHSVGMTEENRLQVSLMNDITDLLRDGKEIYTKVEGVEVTLFLDHLKPKNIPPAESEPPVVH